MPSPPPQRGWGWGGAGRSREAPDPGLPHQGQVNPAALAQSRPHPVSLTSLEPRVPGGGAPPQPVSTDLLVGLPCGTAHQSCICPLLASATPSRPNTNQAPCPEPSLLPQPMPVPLPHAAVGLCPGLSSSEMAVWTGFRLCRPGGPPPCAKEKEGHPTVRRATAAGRTAWQVLGQAGAEEQGQGALSCKGSLRLLGASLCGSWCRKWPPGQQSPCWVEGGWWLAGSLARNVSRNAAALGWGAGPGT